MGAALSLTAVDPVSLSVGLALVGVSSGAVDVAINAAAGRVEATVRGPVITRAHGVFSSAVVLASVATGLAAGRSLSVTVPFLGVGVIFLAAGVHLSRALAHLERPAREPLGVRSPRPRTDLAPLVLIGALGALAFATENAHQSWSAVFAHRELQAGPGSAAVAPAVFAATVAITRFSVGGVGAAAARTVLLVGAAAAAAGALVIAAAPNLLVAVGGLVLAAGGTAVQFPTLLGIVSRDVEESRRGRATSVVTTVAYLGFLLGPVYVGLWADGVGLRGAMLAVAGVGLLLLLLTPTLLRLAQRAPGPIGPSRAPGR